MNESQLLHCDDEGIQVSINDPDGNKEKQIDANEGQSSTPVHSPSSKKRHSIFNTIMHKKLSRELKEKRKKSGTPYWILFLLWFSWMLIGSVFYAYDNDFGWSKGFYMAVSVGYSIGWGFPVEINNNSKAFSCVYVLVGSSAIAASVGFFAQSMIDKSQEWYTTLLEEQELEKQETPWYEKIYDWVELHMSACRMILIWLIWLAILIAFSMREVKWTFIDALYFAISSLSTGGLWAIPDDSENWNFGFVGIFTAIGVPIMALAMSHIAAGMIDIGDRDMTEDAINAPVSNHEIAMLKKIHLGIDEHNTVDRAGYIVLCALRLGVMSPELCHKINSRFDLLDVDGDHVLTISELKLRAKRQSTSRKKDLLGLVKQLNPVNEIIPLVAGSDENQPLIDISALGASKFLSGRSDTNQAYDV